MTVGLDGGVAGVGRASDGSSFFLGGHVGRNRGAFSFLDDDEVLLHAGFVVVRSTGFNLDIQDGTVDFGSSAGLAIFAFHDGFGGSTVFFGGG